MISLLITSVGSLIGQNILDVLETRRSQLRVMGANSVANNPQNFRCDTAYLSPPTALKNAFEDFLLTLIEHENPDLILSGRDQDTLFLADFRERYPHYADKIPYASAELAQMTFDKSQTLRFTQKYHLPFAESIVCSSNSLELQAFCDRVGFPLIIKPILDSDASAVRLVRRTEDLDALFLDGSQFLFQEYLGDPALLLTSLEVLTPAPPLFFQAPDTWHCSCQSGAVFSAYTLPVFCSYDKHVLGRTEQFKPFKDPQLEALAQAYADAFAGAGGLGPLNIQCRRDQQGEWKAFALNMRFGGNTFARWQCGFDELGLLIQAFAPDLNFPMATWGQGKQGTVIKTLRNWFIQDTWVETLEHKGSWSPL